MKFSNFKEGKSLSLANALNLINLQLAQQVKTGEFYYISCLEDPVLGSENLVRCEIGSVSYVLALLCKYSGAESEFFDELDEGHLSGECNVGEEEAQELAQWAADAQNVIIDSSFFAHPDAKMLFRLLEILGLPVVLADGEQVEFATDGCLDELKELENFDGSVVYLYHSGENLGEILGGVQFAAASKIKDGDEVELTASNFSLKAKFRLDTNLKGTVAFAPLAQSVKIDGYAFKLVRVRVL